MDIANKYGIPFEGNVKDENGKGDKGYVKPVN